jgi:hypothetical protein
MGKQKDKVHRNLKLVQPAKMVMAAAGTTG